MLGKVSFLLLAHVMSHSFSQSCSIIYKSAVSSQFFRYEDVNCASCMSDVVLRIPSPRIKGFPRSMILRGGADFATDVRSSEGFSNSKSRRMFAYPWESRGDTDEILDYYKASNYHLRYFP